MHRHLMRPPAGAVAHPVNGAWWESERGVPRLHPEAARGPTARCARVTSRTARKSRWESSGWTHARNVARMLDLMWVRGVVGISRREGAQRVWDLMDRCLPDDARRPRSWSDEEVTRRGGGRRRCRALGAARIPHIRAHFTRGRYPHLPEVLEQLPAHRASSRTDRGRRARRRLVGPRAAMSRALGSRRLSGPAPRSCRRSTTCCATARAPSSCSASRTGSRSTRRSPSAAGATSSSRCSTATGSSRAPTSRIDRKANRLVAVAVHAEPKHTARQTLAAGDPPRAFERLAAWRGATALEVREAPAAWRPTLAA